MAGAGVSGAYGDVKIATTQVSEIKKWTFNPKANVAKYASNKTAGYKKSVAGVKEGSGSLECVWDPAIPPNTVINVGTSVTLKLYTTATQFYQVPAVIADFSIVVDLDTGDPVGYTANFEADGQWTDPVAGLIFDAAMAQQADPNLPGGSFAPGVLMDATTGKPAVVAPIDASVLLEMANRFKVVVEQFVGALTPASVPEAAPTQEAAIEVPLPEPTEIKPASEVAAVAPTSSA